MPRRSIRLALLALLAAGCVTACGETAPSTGSSTGSSTARHEDRLWRPYAWMPARRPFGFGGWKEMAVLDLPWAGNSGPDDGTGSQRRRFLVNLEAGGAVMFKGMRWSLRPEDRATALESLARRIGERTRGAGDDAVPPSVLLRCDYHASFGDVEVLLATLSAAPVSIERYAFAVASSDETSWLDARIDALLVKSPRPEARSLPVVLAMFGLADAREATPRVTIGGQELAFAVGEPYAEGEANRLANVHWQAVRAELRQARTDGVTAVELVVGAPVPWAYVAMLFGLMLEVGIGDVRLESAAFRLSTPALAPAGDVDRGALKDWSPAFALGLGVAGALAVLALQALTGRGRRRHRASVAPIR